MLGLHNYDFFYTENFWFCRSPVVLQQYHPLDTSRNSHYNQDDSMSLKYDTDNSITIDDQPSRSMKSQVLSDAPCPTYSTRFRNQYEECSSTQKIVSHQWYTH